jgi:hypothetical protein
MHPALAAYDIVHGIFRQIDFDDDEHGPTLLSLALVQRSWTSLALDCFWEVLSPRKMACLAKAMSEGTWWMREYAGTKFVVSCISRLSREQR